MDCLFCKIGAHEIPSKILYEDDMVIAFLDIHPTVNGHTLIVPKKHFNDFTELDKETFFHMKEVATTLSKELMQKLNKKGLTLSINYGEAQEIKHIHMHVLPKNIKNEKIIDIEEIYKKLKKA